MPHRLYISFAPDDARFRDALRTHLSVLERSGHLEVLDETNVPAGLDHASGRLQMLDRAHVVVLLLSASFFANDATLRDLTRALARNRDEKTPMIPVRVRAVDLSLSPLAGRKSLPADDRPIDSPGNDQAWTLLVTELRRVLDQLPPAPKEPAPPAPPPAAPPGAGSSSPATSAIPPLPDHLPLSHEQLERLHRIVLKAFPSFQSLSRAVRFGLGESLERIASKHQSQEDVAYELLLWAEARSRMGLLLRALAKQNPHVDLVRFAEEVARSRQA